MTQKQRRNTHNGFMGGFERFLQHLAVLFAIPVKILAFLTGLGRIIPFGIAALYFWGVSVEGYWQTLAGGDRPSFMYKFGINDDPNAAVLLAAIWTVPFWIAAIAAAVMNAIQALTIRELSGDVKQKIEAAKSDFEAVAKHRVADAPEDGLDLAVHLQKKYKRVGMRNLQIKGATIAGSWITDSVVQFANYPIFGIGFDGLGANLFWLLASIFGSEMFTALTLEAWDDLKNHFRTHPKVEVM